MNDEIMQRIKTIANDDSKTEEIFNLLTQEVFDNLFDQLANISTEEELRVYENRINESKSAEHLGVLLNEMATTVYGENAVQMLKEDYTNLLTELEKNINDAKELMTKAQQGDPAAQALLDKAKQTDVYQDIPKI